MWGDPFTRRRMHENSKLIVVEGNVAAGKEKVAKRLADDLGMLYMPPNLDLDYFYKNGYGFDYRALNPLLPERLRHCDFEMFHGNPSRLSTHHMQHFIFKLRLHQYMKALRHIFNTGQGVVLNRSALSDKVFVEAMHNLGWLPRGYLRGDGVRFYDWKMRYNHVRNIALEDLQKPHLVIYVDTPVDVCLKRIQEDPDPIVRNSNALSQEFLEEIETVYKDTVLPKYDFNGVVHTIDGSEELIEDDFVDLMDAIEEIDFDVDPQDTRFETWNEKFGTFWTTNRRKYSSYRNVLEVMDVLSDTPYYDIAGLGDCITNADLILRECLYENHLRGVGRDVIFEEDSKIQGFLKTKLGLIPFEERLERALKADFC